MSGLPGREALVLSPAFFGYERDIVAELTRQGFTTTFVDERPSNRAIDRAIMRVQRNLIARRIETYYREQLARLQQQEFDLVLVIKAEVVPRWFLEALRERNPQARFVFYTYDTLANAGNCLDLLDCFDARLSFDPNDVAARDDFDYLPLFYTPDYAPLSSGEEERRHSLSFIGTLHSQRYALGQRLFAGRERTFGFFFVQARWYFAVVKYLTREHASVPWANVSFRPMTRAQTAEVFRNSSAVLDIQRAGQSGLTMRTFEVLASGAALVTTNAAIIREPFYDPKRIVVLDDADRIDAETIWRKVDSLPIPRGAPAGFGVYSLQSWVSILINDAGTGGELHAE